MTWAELRPAFAKRRYPCAERASAHGLIARNNHELLQDQKKKDPCYRCAYNSHAPCIGFCYQQMTSNPVDPADVEMI